MKLSKLSLTAMAALLVGLLGCAKESPLSVEGDGLRPLEGSALSIVAVNGAASDCVPLIAGRAINAGSVCFDDVDTNGDDAVDALRITITTSEWTMADVKIWAGASMAGAPVNKAGNPVPGHFPYSSGPLTATTYVLDIPFSSLGVTCDQMAPIFVATHVTVKKGGATETAWSDGVRFTVRGNWATYTTVVVTCDKIEEPPDDVCETAYAFGGPTPTCFYDVWTEDGDGNEIQLFSEWGWTNPVPEGTTSFALLARGDGGFSCDNLGAVSVGTVTVTYENGLISVQVTTGAGFGLEEVYLHASEQAYPIVDGVPTVDPVDFGTIATALNKATSWSSTADVGTNGAHLIFRAKVCGPF